LAGCLDKRGHGDCGRTFASKILTMELSPYQIHVVSPMCRAAHHWQDLF
jgi:hypothetical protein